MQDITELQRRITAALDRIGGGLDGLAAIPEAPAAKASGEDLPDPQTLVAELEAERAVTGQLEERLRTSRERSEKNTASLEAEVARCRELLDSMEEDRNRLKAGNEALHDTLAALREASAGGTADAALVDSAMATELEAIRAARKSDRAELDAVISLLGAALDQQGDHEHA